MYVGSISKARGVATISAGESTKNLPIQSGHFPSPTLHLSPKTQLVQALSPAKFSASYEIIYRRKLAAALRDRASSSA